MLAAFGKYTLLSRIAVGGMAEVFLARVTGAAGFERLLALKRMRSHLLQEDEFTNMFIDEARLAAQLSHPNVAQIFELGKAEGSLFIAMEYINGRDLRSILAQCHVQGLTVPLAHALYVTMQLCDALDYVHTKRDAAGNPLQLVHRDVSPSNVMVSYGGDVKLVDFGIARALGRVSSTRSGVLKGKYVYMSPEQARGLAVDRRSDIFTLGALFFELLTGRKAFGAGSEGEILERVRAALVVPPSRFSERVDPELESIVLRALAVQPEKRYQRAADLCGAIHRYAFARGHYSSRLRLARWMGGVLAASSDAEEPLAQSASVPSSEGALEDVATGRWIPPEQGPQQDTERRHVPGGVPPKHAAVPDTMSVQTGEMMGRQAEQVISPSEATRREQLEEVGPPPLSGVGDRVRYKARTFQVQTGDSGIQKAEIRTQLFFSGLTIAEVTQSYADLLISAEYEGQVRELMETQHREMIDRLQCGGLDDKLRLVVEQERRSEDEVKHRQRQQRLTNLLGALANSTSNDAGHRDDVD